MNKAFYRTHVRPWLLAGRVLLPQRSIIGTSHSESTMNLLGLNVTVERTGKRWKLAVPAVAIGATCAVTLGTGAAYAFWSTSGTGSGSAAAGTPTAMSVNVTGITGVYPTQKTTVPLSVTNTNGYTVALSSITLDSVTPTGTGCTATDITLDSTASGVSGSTYTVSGSVTASGTGASATKSFNVPIAVANLADTCQGSGHSFSLSFTVHGASN